MRGHLEHEVHTLPRSKYRFTDNASGCGGTGSGPECRRSILVVRMSELAISAGGLVARWRWGRGSQPDNVSRHFSITIVNFSHVYFRATPLRKVAVRSELADLLAVPLLRWRAEREHLKWV